MGHLGKKRRKLLERSWAAVFRDHLLAHLPVAELAARFSRELGRPSKDLHAVVWQLILQQLLDTIDATVEPDAYLCERTLRSYRRPLIELGLDQILFRALTVRLISAIGVDTTGSGSTPPPSARRCAA